jgi:hypothetical protein
MCHADQQWTEALPLVLPGIRSSFKADLHASSAELVYGEPLRIPGEFLTQTVHPVEPAHLITQLRQHMAHLRPVPHVFLRQDATQQALEPPYRRYKITHLQLSKRNFKEKEKLVIGPRWAPDTKTDWPTVDHATATANKRQ